MTKDATKLVIAYSDFSRGEFGLLGEWSRPAGSFTGKNVVRYIDGSLGSRNGWGSVFVRSPPASPTIYAIGLTPITSVANRLFWVAVAPTALFVRILQGVIPALGLLVLTDLGPLGAGAGLAPATGFAHVTVGGFSPVTYLTVIGNNLYKIDHVARTITDLTARGAPGACRSIAVYGERLLVGGLQSGLPPNRVYYSNAADFTRWLAGSYFVVGDAGSAVTGLYVVRDRLVIVKGGVDEWWELTGTPGVNDFLRRVSSAEAPLVQRCGAALADDNEIAFGVRDTSSGLVTPGSFTGSRAPVAYHLPVGVVGLPNSGLKATALRLRRANDRVLWTVLGLGFLLNRGGGWSRHDTDGNGGSEHVAYDPTLDLIVSCPANLFSVMLLKPYNDRPPFRTDPQSSIPFQVHFTLPEWWDREGAQVSVRSVAVDFGKWNTGDSTDNTFTVIAQATRLQEGGDGPLTRAATWRQATSASSAAGERARRVFGFEPAWGNGFRLSIDPLRGVAIQKITVRLDRRLGELP
jgi:hypothetical protein